MLWIALVFLLACSGAVSASETALFALNRRSLHAFGRSPGLLRRRVHHLMQRPRRVLMTVLMANTAINVSIFALSYFAFRRIEQAPPAIAALGALTAPVAIIVFGEMLPKAAALANARLVAPLAAALIGAMGIVMAPLLWVLATFLVEPITRLLAPPSTRSDAVTTGELRLLVEHSAHEGTISSTENEMLQAVVALADVSVREAITPRVDMRYLKLKATRKEAIDLFRETGLRRVPVCGDDLDDLRGVLYGRDVFLKPDTPLRELVRRIHFVPEQANLIQVLDHFREAKIHSAAVVDEYGGTAGIVTIEDIVECVVGDVPDADAPRPVALTERLDDNTYRLPGNLSIRLWADLFGVTEIDRSIDTVGGLILSRLGRMARNGDTVRIRNLTLTVDKITRRRIETVIVRRASNGPPATESPS